MSNLTNDEITERIKFVTMDEEDGVPGARFAREMAEEVLKLRAELAALAPLAEAAVEYADQPTMRHTASLYRAAMDYAAQPARRRRRGGARDGPTAQRATGAEVAVGSASQKRKTDRPH